MDISLGKDTTLFIHGRDVSIAIGPNLDIKTDVFFTTQGATPNAEVGKFFQGAGEYEVQGVMVDGIATGSGTTSYHIIHDAVSLAAVTLQRVDDLTDEMMECLRPADVLVLWLSQGTAQDIAQLMASFDAFQLIPAQMPCDIDTLEKEMQMKAEVMPKLKLSAKNYVDGARLLTVLD